MFAEGGRYPAVQLDAMSAAFGPWLAPRLADGRYFGWGIEDDDASLLASIGMMWLDWPPHPLHAEAGRGYLLNLYVEPRARRRGLARQLIDRCARHATERGVEALVLHPTAQAAPLYRALGFSDSGELIRIGRR